MESAAKHELNPVPGEVNNPLGLGGSSPERELIQSEEKYISELSVLLDTFLTPLHEWIKGLTSLLTTYPRRKDVSGEFALDSILLDEKVNVMDALLMADVKLILNYNKLLLVDLKEAQFKGGGEKIAAVFLQHAPFLKMYKQYIQKFDKANVLITRLLGGDVRFAAFVKCAELQRDCHGLNLQAFLIMPVQRIPRYILLLKEMKKCSKKESEKKAIELAIEQIDKTTKNINTSIEHAERQARFLQLQEMFNMNDLCVPGRELLREGTLNKICHNGRKAFLFVLCSDILFYGEPALRKESSQQTHRLNRIYNLQEVQVIMMPEGIPSFIIRTPNKAFEVEPLSAASIEPNGQSQALADVQSWIHDIVNAKSIKRINQKADPSKLRGRTLKVFEIEGSKNSIAERTYFINQNVDPTAGLILYSDLTLTSSKASPGAAERGRVSTSFSRSSASMNTVTDEDIDNGEVKPQRRSRSLEAPRSVRIGGDGSESSPSVSDDAGVNVGSSQRNSLSSIDSDVASFRNSVGKHASTSSIWDTQDGHVPLVPLQSQPPRPSQPPQPPPPPPPRDHNMQGNGIVKSSEVSSNSFKGFSHFDDSKWDSSFFNSSLSPGSKQAVDDGFATVLPDDHAFSASPLKLQMSNSSNSQSSTTDWDNVFFSSTPVPPPLPPKPVKEHTRSSSNNDASTSIDPFLELLNATAMNKMRTGTIPGAAGGGGKGKGNNGVNTINRSYILSQPKRSFIFKAGEDEKQEDGKGGTVDNLIQLDS